MNSHDGTSAYQLRMGLFRVVCTNGLIVSRGAFPAYCVSHRGNIVDDVIAGALKLSERFESLAGQVERMEQRRLFKDEQLAFAERALALRFPDPAQSGMEALQLLACRRTEDIGDDLWRVYNRCQEHLLRGGLSRRSASGRLTRTRRISSIRRDVQLNGQLWDLAAQVLGTTLIYVRGRRGDEMYLALPNVKGSALSDRKDGLYLQFRRGRLVGWKGDWGSNRPCCN